MNGSATTHRAPLASLLLVGLAVAVGLRVAIGGSAVAASAPAALIFAAALTVLTCLAGTSFRIDRRAIAWGVGGAVVLVLPPLALHLTRPVHPPAGTFVHWAIIVTVVATAEEAFLRGALFAALSRRPGGSTTALTVTSVCFAALHIPLYGWHAAPLDLAVGLWLGALRQTTDTWTAPALCHTLADFTAWWLH
jgi:membrane protease YdiL (CAAX protease family)